MTKVTQQGEAIQRATREFRVKMWLQGSKAKSDRPTRLELEDCGYAIVKVDESGAIKHWA